MSSWIAIASTVDNQVIIAHDEIVLLQEISEYDFDVIVKIYGVVPSEYNALKDGKFDFRIKFNSLRSTELIETEKTEHANALTEIYRRRLHHIINVRGRFEHALNKHKSLLSTQQQIIYNEKVKEAEEIINNQYTTYDGFVSDYAAEKNMDLLSAANYIITKYNGHKEYLRKIERLRIRHMTAFKKAKTAKDFELAQSAIDKDFFINMLL